MNRYLSIRLSCAARRSSFPVGGAFVKSGRNASFSLVEVVLALGIVAIGLVSILGLFPTGLNASRDSANETRASEMSQGIFATLRGQDFTNAWLYGTILDMSSSNQPPAILYADAEGQNITNAAFPNWAFQLTLSFSNSVPGLAGGGANQVTAIVSWLPTNNNRSAYIGIIANH